MTVPHVDSFITCTMVADGHVCQPGFDPLILGWVCYTLLLPHTGVQTETLYYKLTLHIEVCGW